MVKIKGKTFQLNPSIICNSFLLVHYKLFDQLYINHDTKLIFIIYSNCWVTNHINNPVSTILRINVNCVLKSNILIA